MEIVIRVLFLCGGALLLAVWARTGERPLGYFLVKRLDAKARLVALIVLTVGALQFLGTLDLKFAEESLLARGGGMAIFSGGILLAAWGKRTLGANWNPGSDPSLITEGAFKISRHPIYLGGLIAALGAEIALQSFFALAVVPGIFLVNKACAEEEKMILRHFGDQYREYQRRTKRFAIL